MKTMLDNMKKRRNYLSFLSNSTLPTYTPTDINGDQLPLIAAELNNLSKDMDINAAPPPPSNESELSSYDLWIRMQSYKFL